MLIEALACGTPIAASDIPVVHEICDGVDSVATFTVGDSVGLANALERVRTSAAGRARVIERFTVQRWVDGILQLYGKTGV